MERLLALAVLAVVLAGWGVHREARGRIRRAGAHRLAWRWLSGAAWHGQPVSDDAWSWPGGWFWRMSRPRRAAVRLAVTAAAGGLALSWMTNPQVTARAIIYICCILLALAGWLAVRGLRTMRHRRRWLRPLHLAAHARAGIPRSQSPRSWITIAPDRGSVVLALPQAWVPDDKDRQALVGIVVAKTGMESPEVSWRVAGPAPRLELTASRPPPARVALTEIRAAIDQAKADELVWGLGRHGRIIKSSLSGDSPHLGLSMGSGAGKSVTARAILAQMLYHGAIGLILDYKMISHQWARDLPNVAIARRPHEIHAALLWLGREAERRNEVALAGADMDGNVHAMVGPRLIVVGEELNATIARLRAYWRQIRGKDDQQRSPALEALDAVSFMGRQVLMNIIYIGQRLSVKASGGDGDARENIGVIGFGRYSSSNWKMLAGDYAMPPKSLTPGRIQVVSDQVRETQAVFMSALEARQLALAGTVAACPAGMPGAAGVSSGNAAAISGPGLPVVPETPPAVLVPGGRVTLSQAVAEGIVGRSLHAVRKASQRPGFPQRKGSQGLAAVYDAAELAAWDQS